MAKTDTTRTGQKPAAGIAKTGPKPPVKLKSSDFVHLHNHSHYSLLDGLQKIPEMLDRVVEFKMTAVALTDHGTLSGAIEFYQGCLARKLKPIIGLEAYITRPGRKHTDRHPDLDRSSYHLVLLALDNQGYQNLMQLATLAHLDGFYRRPRIDRDLLARHQQGLAVLSGCLGSELGRALNQGDQAGAEATVSWYQKVFGDRYYLEIQDHNQAEQLAVNEKILALADKYRLPAVVTADCHYLKPEDKAAHEVLLCLQTGSNLTDKNRFSLSQYQLHLTDPKQIIDRWGQRPELILNSRQLADRCQVTIKFGQNLLPQFRPPGRLKPQAYLEKLVFWGLLNRYCPKDSPGPLAEALTAARINSFKVARARALLPQAVIDRADYELATIKRIGFAGYFLIVWDFCQAGADRNIMFGPGRGSAAGSIVAYSLAITSPDPLAYDLLFERFLNPDRIAMPDIDIDIEHGRRDEVIEYVVDKYGGPRKVAHIVTFGRMAARNSVRDTARVLNISYSEADQLAKLIPEKIHSLKEAFASNRQLEQQRQKSDQYRELFELAEKLEGTIRNHGVHAAGVVIAPAGADLVDHVPLEVSQKGPIVTQYSMNPIEDLGLLKIDFLGLSNLTTIKNTLRIIRKVYNQTIDPDRIPLDDPATYRMLGRGESDGVFQLESSGMRNYLIKLAPTDFEDIAVLLALYRPGPIQAGFVDSYINRKHGREPVTYPDPVFEPALKSTYGLPVYQEQVIRISRDVCGFSFGQSDSLRKAIGKKLKAELMKNKKLFIDGGVKHSGVKRSIMEAFWEDLLGYAQYAFNRSHSVCYGLITYRIAYLKANYGPALMASLMTTHAGNIDQLKNKIDDAADQGIKVLPPDINLSHHEFALIAQSRPGAKSAVVANEIRFGLDAVKSVGSGAVEAILQNRQTNGPFADLADFCQRLTGNRLVSKKVTENLIKSGSFDFCRQSRQNLLSELESIWLSPGRVSPNQTQLFGSGGGLTAQPDSRPVKSDILSQVQSLEQLTWERQLLGVYLSGHPLDNYKSLIARKPDLIFMKQISQRQTSPEPELESFDDPAADGAADQVIAVEADRPVFEAGQKIRVVGLITRLRQFWTKSKEAMVFIDIEDQTGQIELPVFPDLYKNHQDQLVLGAVFEFQLYCRQVRAYGGRPNWQIDRMQLLELELETEAGPESRPEVPAGQDRADLKADRPPPRLWLKIDSESLFEPVASQVRRLLAEQKFGSESVVVVIGDGPDRQIRPLVDLAITSDDEIIRRLGQIKGVDQVKLTPAR